MDEKEFKEEFRMMVREAYEQRMKEISDETERNIYETGDTGIKVTYEEVDGYRCGYCKEWFNHWADHVGECGGEE